MMKLTVTASLNPPGTLVARLSMFVIACGEIVLAITAVDISSGFGLFRSVAGFVGFLGNVVTSFALLGRVAADFGW